MVNWLCKFGFHKWKHLKTTGDREIGFCSYYECLKCQKIKRVRSFGGFSDGPYSDEMLFDRYQVSEFLEN